jgi:hypothetical protein
MDENRVTPRQQLANLLSRSTGPSPSVLNLESLSPYGLVGAAVDTLGFAGDAIRGNVDWDTPEAKVNALGAATFGMGGGPGTVTSGVRLYHGSPRTDLARLAPSERGPLGPGVYLTPDESLARRYAGPNGKVYDKTIDDADIFQGIKSRDSSVNNYQVWRDQTARLVNAADEGTRVPLADLMKRMDPNDGYPFYARLRQLVGGDEAAQALFKRAGYKGMSGLVDGPEVVHFGDLPMGITAYHGSPHSFDRFDMSKIGTGEGAQTYGHGLYFAEREGVAKQYRDDLSKASVFLDGQPVSLNGNGRPVGVSAREGDFLNRVASRQSPEAALAEIDDLLAKPEMQKFPGVVRDLLAEKEAAQALLPRLRAEAQPGSMYEVRINAEPQQFLDWDAPITQQGETGKRVWDALKPPVTERPVRLDVPVDPKAGEFIPDITGQQAYASAARGSPETAAATLREAGIPGIRYLDQGSRLPSTAQGIVEKYGSREAALEVAQQRLKNASFGDLSYWDKIVADLSTPQSSNYVLFDDKIIDIIRKYGMLPPLATGLALAGGDDASAAPYQAP